MKLVKEKVIENQEALIKMLQQENRTLKRELKSKKWQKTLVTIGYIIIFIMIVMILKGGI